MELKNWLNSVVYALVVSNIFVTLAQLQLLPQHEVDTLETIFEKLHFEHGNISRSFCSSNEAHNATMQDPLPIDILININCSCSGTVCHVTNIEMRGQNLSGTLPAEFADLSQLTEIDLVRNYIKGGISLAFIKLPLTILSLSDNPIGGSIPKEIGDIGTLEQLFLEGASLWGQLPPNLGSLNDLKRLLLSSNNFTGTIPDTFGKLKNLTDFRIDGSGLHGKVPSLIGNWTKITVLDMQGTSMEGPLPDSLSQLKDLVQLRISDLTGSATTTRFPNLQEMKNLEKLVLRNCDIVGPIPDYIGLLPNLTLLDLSFNLLASQIPLSLPNAKLKYMFLNSNLLYGTLPSWVSGSKVYIDISYNNFTGPFSITCSESRLNAVASASSTQNSTHVWWCLKKDLPCLRKRKYYSLFVNCGGDAPVTDKGNVYEVDSNTDVPSHFYAVASQKWACSSTGAFMYTDSADYTATNTFSLDITGPNSNKTAPDYYQTARVAPSSLKYYGLCLRKGSYKVRLHFAEIMFSNDQTFSSLGNRIFDVSIQEKRVLENFNIAKEAGGVGKAIYRDFVANVSGSTLEIHLYWSGKGSTSVPHRGVYGPLISAISVTSKFNPHSGLSHGVIIGIVVSSCVFLVFVLFVLRMKGYLGGKDPEDEELRSLRLQTGYFTLRQIKAATNNFGRANKIGEGGFGPVYKGILSNGTVIAVKQLSAKSRQGNREFINEIGMISALQHPNLVKLFGCCIEGNQLLVIYEYMENNSLARALFGDEKQRLKLDWPTRKKICIGIARGLAYLHEESRLKIVHRDIKATNVLLDKDLNAKISDFGLAKLDEEENTHISTRIAGTVGYMAPEYATRGYLTDKADVYSFGIVALEIVSGKSNTNYRPREEFVYLLDWAYVLQGQGQLLELVDPELGSNYSVKEVMNMLNVGLLCTNLSPSLRPTMSNVVSMLEGKNLVQATVINTNSSHCENLRFKAFEQLSLDSGTHASSSSSGNRVPRSSLSIEGPCLDSTTSIHDESEIRDPPPSSRLLGDLYDINID